MQSQSVGLGDSNELLRDDLDECLARTRGLWEELRDQRIFITGATGFFGCWLLETLLWANRRLQLNAQVTILTRQSEGAEAQGSASGGEPGAGDSGWRREDLCVSGRESFRMSSMPRPTPAWS